MLATYLSGINMGGGGDIGFQKQQQPKSPVCKSLYHSYMYRDQKLSTWSVILMIIQSGLYIASIFFCQGGSNDEKLLHT